LLHGLRIDQAKGYANGAPGIAPFSGTLGTHFHRGPSRVPERRAPHHFELIEMKSIF
jgi:hypothetical protein